MSCTYSHKCTKCNRILAKEKREEERDAERSERKREKRRRKKSSGNWAIYAAVIIAVIMAISVINNKYQASANSTTQQEATK